MPEKSMISWKERLPEVEPPATLWPRIDRARRQRRRGFLLAPAIAATVAATGLGLAVLVAPPAEMPVAVSGLDALIEDNRRLFEVLHSQQVGSGELPGWQAQRVRSLQFDLAQLDRKLQQGYTQAGGSAELESLWRTRAALLGNLIETYEQPRDIRRI